MTMQTWNRGVSFFVLSAILSVGCATGDSTPAGKNLAAAGNASAAADRTPQIQAGQFNKPGFFTQLDPKDNRLWVFKEGSDDLAEFKAKGAPARHVLRPGAGPQGMTLKSTESETIVEYVVAKPGFFTQLDPKDGRLWVFKADSKDLAEFKAKGTPARHVLRPGAGPLGLTLKSTEFDDINAYLGSQ